MNRQVEKIKAVREEGSATSGPAETVTLGFRFNGRDYIIGSYYIGPYMAESTNENMRADEAMIDELVRLPKPSSEGSDE